MNSSKTLNIMVDIHEPDKLIDSITKRIDGFVTVKSMETSDVMLEYDNYKVMFEIKRTQDFDHSLHSGRLSDQIIRCYEQSDLPILIIEAWKPWVSEKDNRLSIAKKMRLFKQTYRTMNRRVATYETKNNADTVSVIREIAKDLINGRIQTVKRPIIIEDEVSDEIKILCACPQVSKARAEQLLDHYGSVNGAFHSIDSWHELKIGMTEERSKRVFEAVYGGSE